MKYEWRKRGWKATKHVVLDPIIKRLWKFHRHDITPEQHPDDPCDTCIQIAEWEESPHVYEDEIKNAYELICQDV